MPNVLAPVSGLVRAMADVPDPVFSGQMVGPGLAIVPDDAPCVALSPVPGRVAKAYPHAFVIEDECALSVLVHLGIDTIELDGAGFDVLVEADQRVESGAAVVSWRPGDVRASGRDPICPVVALEMGPEMLTMLVEPGQRVEAGAPLFSV